MSVPTVEIHYHRPPDRKQVFRQHLVLDAPDVKVSFADDLTFDPPLRIEGQIALETGSEAVWFTFPDTWHDIGLFYRADGTFAGTYANIITPCEFESATVWHTTDWFLDVWLDPKGRISVLDEDEFEAAVLAGWVPPETADRARAEVERILQRAGAGEWPPPVVSEWTRARARAALTGS